MKKISGLFLFLFIAASGFSQNNTIPSPNTETAYLNYDYRFQKSGFTGVETKYIFIKAGEKLNLYFTLDSTYDYVFIACADSNTKGPVIKGKMGADTLGIFRTDSSSIINEFNSKLIIYNLPEKLKGNLDIIISLLGNVNPAEPTYYMLYRKKAAY